MLELTLPWLLFPAAVLCDADAFTTSAIATPRVRGVCFNSCDSVLTPGFAVQQRRLRDFADMARAFDEATSRA